jgi:hypothetical protein
MHKINLPSILQPFECHDLVRIGKNYDGGYLVNVEDISKATQLISFGVGPDWSFEKQFIKINDCPVIAYDEKIDSPDDEYRNFFVGKRKHILKNIGHNYNNVRFENVIQAHNLFLKCDIEGAEYDLFSKLIEYSSSFVGMVIEVHNLNERNNLINLFNLISKLDLKLVHIHVNNYFYYKKEDLAIPDILELTFSSSKNTRYNPHLSLPHRLDMPNNPNDGEFQIDFI